ncbi:MAG: RIP metalloprotease RseP [Alphaproteobacteria bacterium]|nr:RIP metalloprotease RseP [Alphaproteobacteria bacterium]MBV9862717.1 RIP metalloprotease RseP [Alphaproteobacteria bacterium]
MSLGPLLHGGLYQFLWVVFWFLIVLTVLVFVHELGHYLLARRNGVRVEVFSVGFGRELFGWYDRAGTRWKFSVIPLGGYVKMFGDSDVSSGLPVAGIAHLAQTDRDASFYYKKLWQRAAIVAGGPIANFVFAIVILAALFMTYGEPFTPAEVGQVQPGSAAETGGVRPGDLIIAIDGHAIDRFEDVQQAVRLNPGVPMEIVVRRDGQPVTLNVTPSPTEVTDRFGNHHHLGLLGIGRSGVDYVKRDPATAVLRAVSETWSLSSGTLEAMWQIVVGMRATDELGGPLRIAQISGEVAQGGVVPLLWFMAVLSINLGLINLFPVPVLDGGHLLFYAAEAIRGKPLGQRAQEYGFRIGLALVLTLMVFATWNDLVHIGLVDLVKRLVT